MIENSKKVDLFKTSAAARCTALATYVILRCCIYFSLSLHPVKKQAVVNQTIDFLGYIALEIRAFMGIDLNNTTRSKLCRKRSDVHNHQAVQENEEGHRAGSRVLH